MKNLLLFVCACASIGSRASTSITTPTVSGHWTLGGSPYLVYNNISIDSTSALTIDAGVSVLFQGSYGLLVNGMLHAAGTASSPIVFTVNDTTGWWNNGTAIGGWHGLQFQPYGGTGPDTSLLQYCTVSYTKFDSADALAAPTLAALYAARTLAVRNCTFSSNKSAYLSMMYVLTAGSQAFTMSGSTLTGNDFSGNLLYANNFYGGSELLDSNEVSGNWSGSALLSFAAANLQFIHNQVYDDSSVDGTLLCAGVSSGLTTRDCHATIRGNSIHHNVNTYDAAVVCFGGMIDLNANLVCNNQHTSGAAGYADGGGGLNIAYNTASLPDSTRYLVRNNVIANNYSPYHGGGINILDAQAVVANNQVVNNSSAAGGGIYLYTNYPVTIKNNVLYGNVTTGDSTALNTPDVEGTSTTTLAYDHNWTEHYTLFGLALGTGFTNTGDSATNIRGGNPMLVAPTLTSSVGESALTADFGLHASSPCIDAGDSAGADVYTTDYAGNARIMGSGLDIGAIEFDPVTLHATGMGVENRVTICPNPASGEVVVSAAGGISDCRVLNMLGQEVQKWHGDGDKITLRLDGLPQGMYLVVVNQAAAVRLIKD